MKKNNNKANAGKQNVKNAQNGQNNAKNCAFFFWAFFWDLASFSFFPDTSGTSM